ncbi:hypothetical protein C9I28_09080 [Pseudoduganella armeniaca]|uniref:Uncharacterized protein n=2 Tax=Pseudoduganella armeniaca TaxID=2072590 RepID=A0A2R4C8G4_9BURK|nr:hypothetical protein C9I28_09080 [Pseudoduganella armeniaca]
MSEEYEFEELSFESILERIYISLSLLIESLGYTSLLDDFKEGYKKFDGKLTRLSMLPYVGEFHSDVLGYFWQYHRTLSSLLGLDVQDVEDRKDRARLESILQNTAKIVFDREVIPSNEAEVRKCVYQLLIHVFPDTVREIPISQVTKTYKPDIGVRSLKAAAEYKYAATEEEAKKAIGGFYEDMRGYAGSNDWTHFYAVIYMTKPFFTLQQIQAEFSDVGVNPGWQPILVSGEGGRKKAKT